MRNIEKHGVSIYDAQYAFGDKNRIILEEVAHSLDEERYFCIGKIEGGIISHSHAPRGNAYVNRNPPYFLLFYNAPKEWR